MTPGSDRGGVALSGKISAFRVTIERFGSSGRSNADERVQLVRCSIGYKCCDQLGFGHATISRGGSEGGGDIIWEFDRRHGSKCRTSM